MKTLVESIFGDNITSNPSITSLKAAGELAIESIEKALHERRTIITPKTSRIIWKTDGKKDKWFLVYVDDIQDMADDKIIYLQCNKLYALQDKYPYDEEYDNYQIRLIVRISQSMDDESMICVNSIICDIFKDMVFQTSSSYLNAEIGKYTGLKHRYFNEEPLDIIKYLDKLFVNFKKSVSNGEFDEVLKYLYLHNHTTSGTRYEQEAFNILEKTFGKIVK